MKSVVIQTSAEQIDAFIASKASRMSYNAFALFSIAKAVRKENLVWFYGYFYTAKGEIVEESGRGKAVLNLSVSNSIKAVFIFVYVFLCLFLFYDKVTINGNVDPSIIERITFVLVGFVAWTIPLVLLFLGVQRFGEKLKLEIESDNL